MLEEEEAAFASSTMIGASMIGASMLPAKAVEAATESAAASAIFFIVISSRIRLKPHLRDNKHPRLKPRTPF
jgi:hypothetical protein